MKNKYLLLPIALIIFSCSEQPNDQTDLTSVPEEIQEQAEENSYDSLYAAELGADEYGMKTYVMAFLKSGPNRSQDSTEAARIQRAHLDNIQRMANEGKLIVAGPFLDDGEVRGIYIFNVATVEEARALTQTDPAVQEGRLEMELHPWYGSAVLQEIANLHAKVSKEDI